MNDANPKPAVDVSRRQAMQWVLAATAAAAMPNGVFAQAARMAPQSAHGYGVDPKLIFDKYDPGTFWPLTFNEAQRRLVTVLADVIIPKDALGPAASEVGVPAFVDEWISAPYPEQREDSRIILRGLDWLQTESRRRFSKPFEEITEPQRHQICDDICFEGAAKPRFRRAAVFFSRFRWICAAAYYATPQGFDAIGYVGNVILPHFDGPPPEVLQKLGVTQTVK